MNLPETQNVDEDYKTFLLALGKRIKSLRNERGLSLRDMVVVHGYHDSQWRRMEREGAGNVQSLLKVAKAFQMSLSELLAGLGEYPMAKPESAGRQATKATSKRATNKTTR